MPCPQSAAYNEAIQNLRTSVSDEELRGGEPALNALGLPMPASGAFADVYKVVCPATGGAWAVKCFTREAPGLRDRYRAISEHLWQRQLPFTVEFDFIEPGIRVGQEWFPFLKMRWVEGLRLNRFVGEFSQKPKTLQLLFDMWVRLADRLRRAQIAHGDLQHGNVLLLPEREGTQLRLKLVDYDGMHVPALAAKRSGEVGHPAYQHPQRIAQGLYGAEADRFSHLAICTALRCVMVAGRRLWDDFDNGDNLLFREADFQRPEASELFHRLWDLPRSETRALVGRLILACKGPYEQVPLLDDVLDGETVRPLTPAEQGQVEAVLQAGSLALLPVPRFTPPADLEILDAPPEPLPLGAELSPWIGSSVPPPPPPPLDPLLATPPAPLVSASVYPYPMIGNLGPAPRKSSVLPWVLGGVGAVIVAAVLVTALASIERGSGVRAPSSPPVAEWPAAQQPSRARRPSRGAIVPPPSLAQASQPVPAADPRSGLDIRFRLMGVSTMSTVEFNRPTFRLRLQFEVLPPDAASSGRWPAGTNYRLVVQRARGSPMQYSIPPSRRGDFDVALPGWRPDEGPFTVFVEDSGRMVSDPVRVPGS